MSEVKRRTFEIGPAIELEEYLWLKTRVTVEVEGPDSKNALKKAELEYWRAVELDLKLSKDVTEAFESGEDRKAGMKKIAKLAKGRIEILSNLTNRRE